MVPLVNDTPRFAAKGSQMVFLLIYSHFYYLMPVRYSDPSSFSLIDKKWQQHQMPVSVVARSGSYLSVFEQTAQNFPCLLVRDDIQAKNSDRCLSGKSKLP